MSGREFRVSATGGTDKQTGLAMVILSLCSAPQPYQDEPLAEKLVGILKELQVHTTERNATLSYERDTIIFHEGRIFIVRPNILLNWTRTAAINDAARIYAEVALAGEVAQ